MKICGHCACKSQDRSRLLPVLYRILVALECLQIIDCGVDWVVRANDDVNAVGQQKNNQFIKGAGVKV